MEAAWRLQGNRHEGTAGDSGPRGGKSCGEQLVIRAPAARRLQGGCKEAAWRLQENRHEGTAGD